MSSLRVETLRLCWLEAFIEVANEENISEAANVLAIDQSTASRYLQSLERWLGKKLIEPGKISDPNNPRLSIGLTDDGREFFALAKRTVADLHEFRGESTRRREIAEEASGLVSKMQTGMERREILEFSEEIRTQVELLRKTVATFSDGLPMDFLVLFKKNLRALFNAYEVSRNRERRRRRAAKKGNSGRSIRVGSASIEVGESERPAK